MEETISLDEATRSDGHDILEMLREIPALETGFENDAHALEPEKFEEYLKCRMRLSKGINLNLGEVPMTTFWLRIGGYPVGMSRIFHLQNFKLLNEVLNDVGFISYCVRPSERNKKYGNLILRKTLEKAREMKYGKVLLVCQEKNLASRKCIENNGGVFEKTHDAQCHYWITFGDTGTAAVRQ